MPAPNADRKRAPGRERPWVFGLLIAPYGVLLQGIVQGGVLGFLLSLGELCVSGSGHGLRSAFGWALIYFSSRVSREMLGLIAACLVAAPALAVFAAPRQEEISDSTFHVTLQRIGSEFRATFLRWDALPYIVCLAFPIGTGAAVGLLPGIARQYGVNGDQVAWINGLLSMAGVASIGADRPWLARRRWLEVSGRSYCSPFCWSADPRARASKASWRSPWTKGSNAAA